MRNTRDSIDEIPDEHIAQDLLMPAATSVLEEANIPALPEEWAAFLEVPLKLPNDVILVILRFLNATDLMAIKWVNRTAHWLARRIQFERYRTQLQDSLLWKYLPAIADDTAKANGLAFIDYVVKTTNIVITDQNRQIFSTLTHCLSHMKTQPLFPANWNGAKVNEAAQLQELATMILKDFPRDAQETPTTLIVFMNCCAPNYSQHQELQLWQHYRQLVSQVSTLMLFIRMKSLHWHNQQHPERQYDDLRVLIDPHNSQWLSGYGLMGLNSYVPDTFSRLVRGAIRLFKKGDKNTQEKQRLMRIESLLERLAEADLLHYIPLEYYSPDKRPDDPTAILGDRRNPDPARTLMIETILADYSFLMKKLTQAVLFKIERMDFDRDPPKFEYTLNEARIIRFILCRPQLLKKINADGIVRILCILVDSVDTLRNYSVLWPLVTFEVIERWLVIDHETSHHSAKEILSNAVILKSLTNAQILFIAGHLRSLMEDVLNSPTFRARLEEDKVQSGHRENKLLMQLAEVKKNSFTCDIAENTFTRALLTLDEARTLILDPKFWYWQAEVMNSLLSREDVINTLSSAELLKAVRNRSHCSHQVANSYLARFNHEDLIDFSISCMVFIDSFNKVEFKILFEKLPLELERRVKDLTSAQMLRFACMHPQIGHFIVDRFPSKLAMVDLRSLTEHYQENSELQQKITALAEARAQEKRQPTGEGLTQKNQERQLTEHQLEMSQARKREQHADASMRWVYDYNPKSQKDDDYQLTEVHTEIQKGTPWAHYLRLAFFTTLGLFGFSFFMLGIGGALGISVAITITSTLFSFLPWSAPLTSVITGYFVYLVSAFSAVSLNNTAEAPTKTQKSSCSTANFFRWFDCCPDTSDIKATSQAVPLPKIHFQPPPLKVGYQPSQSSGKTPKTENEERQTFSYYQ